jgi:hypothetical protein
VPLNTRQRCMACVGCQPRAVRRRLRCVQAERGSAEYNGLNLLVILLIELRAHHATLAIFERHHGVAAVHTHPSQDFYVISVTRSQSAAILDGDDSTLSEESKRMLMAHERFHTMFPIEGSICSIAEPMCWLLADSAVRRTDESRRTSSDGVK